MIKTRIATIFILSMTAVRILSAPRTVYCQAEDAQFDKNRITVIQHQDNKRRHNVALKDKELARTPSDGAQPDLTFKVQELTP